MGVDGTVYYGHGIMVNPLYLNDAQRESLSRLRDRYADLFEGGNYSEEEPLFLWVGEPQILTQNLFDRRPLVLDTNNLVMFRNQDDIEHNRELWNKSYDDIAIRVNNTPIDRSLVYGWIMDRGYEPNDNDDDKSYLNQSDLVDLRSLIDDPNVSLDGTWIAYILS